MTRQLEWWRGRCGDDYTRRNASVSVAARTNDWARYVDPIFENARLLEVGCGVGTNLKAFAALGAVVSGVEPNGYARSIANGVCNGDARDGALPKLPCRNGEFHVVVTCGVLIHVPPDDIEAAVAELVRVSSGYVVVAEYFAPKEEHVTYRGESGLLWRRDYGSMLLDAGLKFVRVEFAWRRDSSFDDLTIWTFTK